MKKIFIISIIALMSACKLKPLCEANKEALVTYTNGDVDTVKTTLKIYCSDEAYFVFKDGCLKISSPHHMSAKTLVCGVRSFEIIK